jgi:hypothetical protein
MSENIPNETMAAALPVVRIPGTNVPVSQTAEVLFQHIRNRGGLYNRGDQLVEVAQDNGEYEFRAVTPAAAVSRFEDHVRFAQLRAGADGQATAVHASLNEQQAKLLLESRQRRTLLPTIRGLLKFPLLVERNGELAALPPGFDCATGLFIESRAPVQDVPLDEAVRLLVDLLADYEFYSGGDRSRAVASFLTPALKFSRLIDGPIPIDVAEADDSQAGKSFRQTLVPALYNHQMAILATSNRGVGSIDEAIDGQLIKGSPFIQIDNLRGKLNSQRLESIITANGEYSARAAYTKNTTIDTSTFMFFISSNGFEATVDLANRSSIIRQRKRPGHQWRSFDGRNLRDHIRANLPRYQGAVATVVREWYRRGKPRTETTDHSFQSWAQPLDWIVQNLFRMPPLLDGLSEVRSRAASPQRSFLRQIVLRWVASPRHTDSPTATMIVALCDEEGIDIPGLRATNNEKAAPQQVGRILAPIFREEGPVEIDGYRVTRHTEHVRSEGNHNMDSKSYHIERLDGRPLWPDQAGQPMPLPLAA